MISVECDACSQKYKVKPKLAGTNVECKQCGCMMTIPVPTEPPPPPPAPEDDSVYALRRVTDDTEPPTAEQTESDDAVPAAPIGAVAETSDTPDVASSSETEGNQSDVRQAPDSDMYIKVRMDRGQTLKLDSFDALIDRLRDGSITRFNEARLVNEPERTISEFDHITGLSDDERLLALENAKQQRRRRATFQPIGECLIDQPEIEAVYRPDKAYATELADVGAAGTFIVAFLILWPACTLGMGRGFVEEVRSGQELDLAHKIIVFVGIVTPLGYWFVIACLAGFVAGVFAMGTAAFFGGGIVYAVGLAIGDYKVKQGTLPPAPQDGFVRSEESKLAANSFGFITPAIPPPTEHDGDQSDQASEDASQQIPQTPLAKQMQDWQQKAASGIETLSPVVARHASNAKKTAEKAVGQYVSTIKEADANIAGGVPAFVQTAGAVFSIQVIISIVLTYVEIIQAARALGGRVLLVAIGVLVLLSPIHYFIGRFFYRIGTRLAEGSRSALWWFVAIIAIRLLLVLPLYAEVTGWFSFLWWLIGLGLDLFLYVPAAVIAVRNKQEFQ